MYVIVLLYMLEYVSTIIEASKNDVLGAEKVFEKQWQRDGGGRKEQVKQPRRPPRRKRDIIEPKITDRRYFPDDFHGVRSSAIVRIENSGVGHYPGYDLKHSYGVRLQSRMVLTICSGVTYVENPANRVTFTNHVSARVNVTKVDERDITVHVMTVTSTTKPDGTSIQDILIHPNCDNQYEVDLAVLVTTTSLPESRNVWIHTPENLLFRRNLDRVVAAQAVLGKCSVPVYKKIENIDRSVSYTVDYVQVHFQHWDGCEGIVCAYWEEEYRSFQDPDRCYNLRNGTRYCLAWTVPASLCNLLPGTPVFCDVGEIHGLMGFLLRETYSCFAHTDKSSIMQGMNDAIPWLWEALSIRLTKNYDKEIPEWLQNLRLNYTTNVTPRIRPRDQTTQSPDVTYNNFLGQQALSIVNVFFKNRFRCHGALVEHRHAVVPCSCIGINRNEDMTNPDNIINPHRLEHPDDITDFTVSLMVNGSNPQVVAGNWLSDRGCTSHGTFDTAFIELSGFLPNHKLAWLMTGLSHIFGNLLIVTAVADSAMGYNCYWMSKNVESPSDRFRSYVKTKIRFVHWTRCINNVCPTEEWREYQEDRCYGHPDPLTSEQPTQFCIESARREKPACDIRHGTPIFCNVESARGFVGLITKAMDLNETPCSEREPEDQTAVFQGIDKFLPDFSLYTWIHEFELRIREREGEHEAYSFSPSIVSSSVLSIFVVVPIIFIIR